MILWTFELILNFFLGLFYGGVISSILKSNFTQLFVTIKNGEIVEPWEVKIIFFDGYKLIK